MIKLLVNRLAIGTGNPKAVAVRRVTAIRPGLRATVVEPLAVLRGAMLLFLTALTFMSLAWGGENNSIAVIYPDIGEPYRQIFSEIIDGINDKAGTQVANYPVHEDTDIAELKTSLSQRNVKVIIALGRQGMRTAGELNNGIGVVVGGVLTVPENEVHGQTVITLTPDPVLLFSRMKLLMPDIKRVTVIYNPAINSWLMQLAKEAAHAQGLELVTYETQDLRSAVNFYQKFFSAANSHRDALWLPQDTTTVEESTILPLVLQESWNRGIAVFSSNAGYVRRGVLFSLYPDNVALGRSLGGLAQNMLAAGEATNHGMMPLRDVQSVVNLRTAKHLGFTPGRLQRFDMTFPDQ